MDDLEIGPVDTPQYENVPQHWVLDVDGPDYKRLSHLYFDVVLHLCKGFIPGNWFHFQSDVLYSSCTMGASDQSETFGKMSILTKEAIKEKYGIDV